MSLKAFHIVFISLSILLCLGLGTLCVRDFLVERRPEQLAFGMIAFGSALGLLVYFRLFLRKFKEVGLL